MKDKTYFKKYHEERYNKLSWWGKRKENFYTVLDWLSLAAGFIVAGFFFLLPFAWVFVVLWVLIHFIRKFW